MDLAGKGKAHPAKFMANTFLIRRFQQPRSQMSMNLNRGRNDPMRDPVEIHLLRIRRSCLTLHFSSLRLSLRSLRLCGEFPPPKRHYRSEEHTSELQSL